MHNVLFLMTVYWQTEGTFHHLQGVDGNVNLMQVRTQSDFTYLDGIISLKQVRTQSVHILMTTYEHSSDLACLDDMGHWVINIENNCY